MEKKDFERVLRSLLRRRPFRSFTLELMNGDRVEVSHPESVLTAAGVGVHLSAEGVPTVFDADSVCHMTGPKNGRRRRP